MNRRPRRLFVRHGRGQKPLLISTIERVLVVVAHADDLEWGAGGLITLLVANGFVKKNITALVLTNSERGTAEPGQTQGEIEATREFEQETAADYQGIQMIFGGFEDGGLENTAAVRRFIVQNIRDHRPDTIITWEPARFSVAGGLGEINHRDHYVTGEATLAAIWPEARNQWAYPEQLEQGLKLHTVTRVLLMRTGDHPTGYQAVDITEHLKDKLEALAIHASQIGPAYLDYVRRLAYATARRHTPWWRRWLDLGLRRPRRAAEEYLLIEPEL